MDPRCRLGAVALTVVFAGSALAQAAAPGGQEPGAPPAVTAVQFVDEPSDAVVLAVAFDGGHDTDPEAAVLAECRLRAARALVPQATACGHRVVADTAVLFVVLATGEWQLGERFLRALLAPGSPLDDDSLRLAIAHCALQADDAAFLYPGDVLASRARARLGAERGFAGPLRGEPTTVASIVPARVRARLAAKAPAAVLVLGAVPPELRQALADVRCEPLPGLARAAGANAATEAAATAVAANEFVADEIHERIDAPFVAAAFLAPPTVDAAFVLGLQVARARAQKRFGALRSGVLAHAPFVAWSWLAGEPVVLFHRRGPDPIQRLPQEPPGRPATAVVAATRQELVALLDDLCRVPPTAAELAAARAAVHVERGCESMPAARATPAAMLPGRAMARLLAARRPTAVANLDTVDAAAVHAAMVANFRPERACWHALVPAPRSDRAWPGR